MDKIEREMMEILALTDVLITVDSRDMEKDTVPYLACRIKEAVERIWNYLKKQL